MKYTPKYTNFEEMGEETIEALERALASREQAKDALAREIDVWVENVMRDWLSHAEHLWVYVLFSEEDEGGPAKLLVKIDPFDGTSPIGHECVVSVDLLELISVEADGLEGSLREVENDAEGEDDIDWQSAKGRLLDFAQELRKLADQCEERAKASTASPAPV